MVESTIVVFSVKKVSQDNRFLFSIKRFQTGFVVFIASSFVSVISTIYFYQKGLILAYGDAESHINIAKRVVSGMTPGFAQLGGVWLPLHHIMMIPFVWNDMLWRTGLAGSFVSMICFIVSSIYIYRMVKLLTGNNYGAAFASLVFISNPNLLYLQTTPLGELPLIAMIILSEFYLLSWIRHENNIDLIKSAFFVACGSLVRYDIWFMILVGFVFMPIVQKLKGYKYKKIEGITFYYWTLAAIGIIFWLVWNQLIFKNPIYFLTSPYSAKSQQMDWLARGELPSYHNILNSIVVYTVDVYKNSGIIVTVLGAIGFMVFTVKSMVSKAKISEFLILFLLVTPYIFYIVTLFLGISIILIPELVPKTFSENLFNVRYGIMLLPALTILIGYLYAKVNNLGKGVLVLFLGAQIFFFATGGRGIDLQDGVSGLSSRRPSPVNTFVAKHYDYGYIMFDDFSRVANPISLNVPMSKIVYVGNHPLWEKSLKDPYPNVRWLIVRKDENDLLWQNFQYNEEFNKNYKTMYKFEKTYVYRKIST
jgi:hypothetical protein